MENPRRRLSRFILLYSKGNVVFHANFFLSPWNPSHVILASGIAELDLFE